MMRRLSLVLAAALAGALATAPAAGAFGVVDPEVVFEGEGAREAGTHPFAITTTFEAETKPAGPGQLLPDEEFKDLEVDLPEGLAGTPDPVPPCSGANFLLIDSEHPFSACPESAAVGVVEVAVSFGSVPEGEDLFEGTGLGTLPVYNLTPPPGVAAKLGFVVLGSLPVTIEAGVNPEHPYNLQAHVTNIPQAAQFYGSRLTLWGVPANSVHDTERGACAQTSGTCSVDLPEKPFFTMPRSCASPLATLFEARSWQTPGTWVDARTQSPAMSDCEKITGHFAPQISARPTTSEAAAPSGLAFDLEIDDPGLTDPEGRAAADLQKAVVTLPEGMTINPSQAEGLKTCSEAELARESADSPFGAGCPAASKIGTVEVETPLLEEETLSGSLFVAEPFKNRFETLLALYMTIKSPKRGISISLAGKVEPVELGEEGKSDAEAGRLTTTFEDLPQLPFSDFRLRFRGGGRSPLITPPDCGTHEVSAEFTPSSDPSSTYDTDSTFEVESGVGGGPCPPAGTRPFSPGFSAGSENNAAGRHSAFLMQITRSDGEQDLVRFDAELPPGVTGKLAGIERCPEAAIAAADANSGREELADPACPAGSRLGSTMAGAGVGSELTYVPGSLYLAGPFAGAPLSVVAVTPAVAGPFDVGTVVVREALRVDPVTAQVRVDGEASDPIPHELEGIPLALRELRVNVDRPEFVLNPTSCAPKRVLGTLFGGGTLFSPDDDSPVGVTRAARFQAADCARLDYRPRLGLRLFGGVRRGQFPALRAVYAPRPGEVANLRRLALIMPSSAFIEQGHFGSICTRVQYRAEACPPRSVYGHAVAHTPLLDRPLRGPVYLRSSDNDLPDAVLSLRGTVDVEVALRIDSVKGRLRATVDRAPDVPVSRVVVQMRGGEKGLFVNSRHLCLRRNRATVRTLAQNNARRTLRPVVRAQACVRRRRAKRARAQLKRQRQIAAVSAARAVGG